MSDWILGLKKAASGWMPGVSAEEIRRAEERVGEELPEELRALYRQLDGATFDNGVALFPLKGRGQGELGHGAPGLPEKGLWHFGVRGAGGEPLFAARKSALAVSAPSAQHREWFDALPGETWVFGLKDAEGELYVLRSLEQLLAELVPPAETEEFGEQTFVRALRAVGSALDALGDAEGQPGGPAGAEGVSSAGPAPDGAAPAPAASKAEAGSVEPKALARATKRAKPAAEPARARPAASEAVPPPDESAVKGTRPARAARPVPPPARLKATPPVVPVRAIAPKRGAKPAKAAAPKRGAKAAAPKRGAKAAAPKRGAKAAAPKRGAKAAGARKPARPAGTKPSARPAKATGRVPARKTMARPKPARSSPKRR